MPSPPPEHEAGATRRASLADLDPIARLLGSAFEHDPWTAWCVDAQDRVERITALQRLALVVVGLPHGLVWVVEQAGRIVSAAVWTDSKSPIDDQTFADLARRSSPLHGNRLAAAIAAERGGHPRPTADHLFLETMGTRPDVRRRGLGSRALAPGLALADQRGMECALETSTEDNVAFYRSVGFEVVAHRVVPDGGPDVWLMQRPQRPGPFRSGEAQRQF